MIQVSDAYRTALANDNRNFYCVADITFWNGESITVTNKRIWQGSFRFKQAVSGQSAFKIGACVIGEHTLILNNVYGDFDSYDFEGAKIVANIGLYDSSGTLADIDGDGTVIDIDGEGGTTFQKGEFFVDEMDANGSLITLTCLDAMVKLDRNFSEVSLTFPATLQQIVMAVCAKCGVPYTQTSFPNSTYTVNTRPSEDGVTCRDVLGMVCEIACCYSTINRFGSLTIDWFDTAFMQTIVPVDGDLDGGSFWVDVDSADGGLFWDFSEAHEAGTFIQQPTPDYALSGFFKFNHDKNDVRISGARLTQNNVTYLSGSDRYTVSIQNNLLINAGDEAGVIANIAAQLIGAGMMPFSAEHLADPTIEAGDTVVLTDHLGNSYRSVITQTEFSAGERQRTECDAESYVSNQSIRYTSTTKELADYNVRSQAASGLLANAYGLYRTEAVDPQVGGTTAAVHNAETLETSTFAMIDNANGLQVGTRDNATADWTWTAADAAEGAGLQEVLDVVGINADWIKTGELDVGGADTSQAVARIRIYDESGNLAVTLNKVGLLIDRTVTYYASNYSQTDLDTAQQIILGTVYPTKAQLDKYDIDGDGAITASDLLTISKFVNGAETSKTVTVTLQVGNTDTATLLATEGVSIRNGGLYSQNLACGRLTAYSEISSIGVYNETTTAAANLVVLGGGSGKFYRSTSSSLRYKTDITEDLGELNPNVLYDLKVVKFKFKDGYVSEDDERYGKDVIGFIAEDVDELYPIAVRHEDGQAEMWESNYMIPAMLKLIQEQKKQIEALEARITALEERSK